MSLDEKICYPKDIMPNFQMKLLPFDEVKQFIKELKEKLPNFTFDTDGTSHNLHDIINKIFGKGLI